MNRLKLAARQALDLIDLTSLNDGDKDDDIVQLCQRARTDFGPVAAVCIKPEFITAARRALDAPGNPGQVAIATVVNFPAGEPDVARAVAETEQAVAAGADEIDLVFPWRALLDGDEAIGQALVGACRQACPDQVLKVILETGELQEPALMRKAGELAIAAGADFLKTSTGKVPVNATLSAATVLMELIREHGGKIGFKAAGGIRTTAEAATYLVLAEQIMGTDWINASHFRFGASGLLDDVLVSLGQPDDSGQQPMDY